MEIMITIGGLLIGMLFGGLVLAIVIRNAMKKCEESYREDEKDWEESDRIVLEESDNELPEK